MTAFFHSAEARLNLAREARAWAGTPFRPHAAVQGAGADCVGLALGIYQAVGFLGPKIGLPRAYTIDGGKHLSQSAVMSFIESLGRFQPLLDATLAEVGDLLGFNLGRVVHHVGIVITPDRFIHSYRGLGVTESDFRDPTWFKRLMVAYRPVR